MSAFVTRAFWVFVWFKQSKHRQAYRACMIIGAKATRATDQRGTDYATSDEIHGQYYVVDTVKRLHGHGDQALEWWALYVGKKERSLLSMYEWGKCTRPRNGEAALNSSWIAWIFTQNGSMPTKKRLLKKPMRNVVYHLQVAFLGIELNNHQVNSFVIIHISRIDTPCGLMKTHHPNVVCPSWPV